METLKDISNCFLDDCFCHVKVYGCEVSLHTLPMYIPDMFLLREIAYQMTITRITKTLQKDQRKFGKLS